MRKTSVLVFTAVSLLSVGCFRSPNTRFYSLVSEREAAQSTALSPDGVSLEVSRIVFPEYLDDPRIAVRSGSYEVVRDEYERWVEDLNVNFRRALLEDLARNLKSSNVFSSEVYSRRPGSKAVQVEVLQFDVTDDGKALLKVRWASALNRDALASASLKVSEFTAVATDSSSEARVSALSGLINSFAQEVAGAIVSSGAHGS